MITKQHHFRNSNVFVQDIPGDPDAEPPVEGGKMLVIIDGDSGDSYHFASNNDTMKRVGQQLMGIGHVELPNGHVMTKIINEAKKGRR